MPPPARPLALPISLVWLEELQPCPLVLPTVALPGRGEGVGNPVDWWDPTHLLLCLPHWDTSRQLTRAA